MKEQNGKYRLVGAKYVLSLLQLGLVSLDNYIPNSVNDQCLRLPLLHLIFTK